MKSAALGRVADPGHRLLDSCVEIVERPARAAATVATLALDARPQDARLVERAERAEPRGPKFHRLGADERLGERIAHGANGIVAGEAEELERDVKVRRRDPLQIELGV